MHFSPTVSQSLNCALFVVPLLLYSLQCRPLLMCFPLSLPLRPSLRACKGALIERNINLQVTNSSQSSVGAGVYAVNCYAVKPGPPRLLCHLRLPTGTTVRPDNLPEPQHSHDTTHNQEPTSCFNAGNDGEFHQGQSLDLGRPDFSF